MRWGGILEDQRGTENLYVASNSEVLFAGESGTEQYSQYVHGLTGSGTLNLGSSAKLYLHQSGTGTGHISEIFDDDGDSLGSQIVISNVFAGSGVYDADTGSYSSSGAVFNVNLSGDVSGYEVVFTDNGSGYSGLINLTNSAVTAYDADRDVVIGGQTYTPNALLTSATVQLLDGGRLLVDGKGSAHNLIIDSENSAITFENLELGNGTLELDNLSLKNNGKIEIENITSDYQDEIDKKGFLEADEGITETLIHVSASGSIAGGDRYGLSLGGSAVEGKQTTLSGGDVLANLYWNFDSDLIYSADDKTYSANYSLTKVDVQSGQFALEKTEDTGETATFTAEVSGAGGLLIDALGTTVYLGNTETGAPANSYEGVTTVTEGTNVVLAVDDAMGKTSSLEAKGNVTLENGVAQTIGGLTGSGTLTMESGSVLTLNQSGDVSLDNVLSGIGTFKVSGTGSNKSNVVFNGEFTYGGSLDFSNTVFDFDEGGNRSVASAADFNLSNSTLHLGESGGTFGNMTINDGVQFDSAYLVIGSTTPSLSGSGTLNLNANTNITLEGISVADNIALINFDENTRYQDFITASGSIRGSGSVTLVPSPELTLTNYTYTGTYRQNGNIVANTTWTIAQGLQRDPASHSLQAGAVLTGIELTGGELVISGAGTLTAAITQRGGANASLTFRTSGTNPEAMTVLHSNNFTAGVGVDTGVTLTLAADSALGTTSGLTVASGAIVKLNDGISQTVGGLAGIGSVELGSGSEFTLRQDGDARIETAVSGGGEQSNFTVNLGSSSNALTFANSTAYNGKFVLQNALLQFADATDAERVLGGSTFVLDGGAVFELQNGAAGTLQNFVFDGGTLKTHQTTLSGAGTPQLIVTGDVSLDASSTIEAGGIVLSGGSDILRADNTGGVRQVFIQYSGNYSSADGQTLTIPDDALANSNIYNDGNTTDVVAKGKWSGSVGVDENGKQIYGDLQLIEINLIEEEVDRGLVLNASGAADTTLSALVTGSGNITFAGDMTIDGTADNTYTGTTTVSGGTVTLAKRNAFGETNYLNVSGDGHVNFNAQSTRIGRIQTSEAGALTGSGSITLFGQGRSNITGANTGLNAAISMLSGHTTVINDANGLGTGGITLNDGSTLILNYTNQGVAFDNTLTGGGTLQLGVNDSIYGSAALITGANAGFSGQIFITSNSLLNAEGVDVDDTLGTGLVRFGNEHSYLRLRSSGDSITLDNAFSGNGRIVVGGRDAGDQWFGFETTNGWTDGGFTGTLVLSKAGMRVGGAESANYGENNAANLRTASLELLDNRAKLEVSSGGTVRTFQDLLIDGGATVSFDGTAGFNAGNALADLAISGTLTLGSGNIALTLPGAEADMTGSLAHNQVIDTALRDAFETLIAAADGVSGNLSGITLNNGSTTGYSGTQNITGTRSDGSDGDVAYGRFNYGLATTDNALGLSFTLSEIDIIKGQTLVLAETGTLGATVDDDQTGTGSGGNLEIAALNTVTLNGKNTYTGKTTVRGKLTAGAQGLGRTSLLSVESGGSYANDGSNMVGGLSVNQDGVLILDSSDQVDEWTLTIDQSGTESSTIAGAVQGAGDLILNAGQLTVNAHNDTNWRGNLALGTETASAVLYLSGVNALGNGTVSFANSGSVINLAHNADLAFGNAVSGYGTITVDIDGHNFTFTNAEADLTAGSHLNLLNADFSLDAAQNADVAQKTLISLGSESTLFTNGGTEAVNRSIWGLDLTSGGTIHFGNIDASGGQLVLSSGIGENIVGSGTLNLSTNQAVTIVFNGEEGSTGSRVDDDNTGASLLSGGGTFDLDLFEGVTNLTVGGTKITSGGQINKGLQTERDFSSTSENYYQDADGDDASDDLVAVLRRGGSGTFFYDADRDAVYMKYGIREIDLQRSVADQGLMLNASGMTGAELSARVTGKGNIVFVKGEIAVSGQTNDYLGSTYVKDGASVTLSASSAFGKTDYLQIDTGGTVTLGSKVAQTVGELAGSGWLVLGAGSSFEIDNSQRKTGTDNDGNDPTAKDSFAINAIVMGAQGATFTIDGAGASTSGGRANVTFGATSNLTGTTLVYENMDVSFDSAGKGDHAYQTAASSSDLMLGTNSHLTVHANSGGSAQTYSLSNELSFDGGQIIFDDVTLTSGSTSAILHVGTLDLTQTGSIGVVATIDSGFNILDADTQEFQQTLIQYGQLALGSSIDNLRPAFDEDIEDSRIYAADGRTVLAYVGWSGGIVDPAQAAQNTIAMSYQANALKLAQSGESDGLVLDATGLDSTLSILVTDADEVKNNGGGNITFAGGDIIVDHENGYTGVTKVTAGSVTIAQNSGFGRTSDLQVAGGAYVDLSGHEQTAGAIHTAGAHALRGKGTLTLGISGNDLNASFISGSNNAEGEASGFAGTVVLTNGHSLVLDNTAGLGDGTTADLQSGTLTVSGADGTFATTLTGAGTMAIEGGEVSIAGNNSSFSGAWRLSNTAHTTVSGSNALSADELLGTGDVNLADGTTMSLSDDPSKTGWSIDNAFVGAGRLEVLGTNSDQLQDFSFSKTWDPNAFTGSFEIGSGIRYTVASGSSNAVNMANGRAVLDEGAELQVATGGVVDTFDALNGSGGTIRFNGELGIDASTDKLGKLQVGSLAGSGDIAVSVPGENDKVDQDLRETGVIDRDDNGFFQSLIIAENGTVTAEGWTLNGGTGGSGLHQGILNAAGTDTVAQAIYRYGLEAGKDGDRNALGVGFDLETVDISGGKTLTLSEEGTLDAVVTNSSGSGNLTIAGKVVLSNADNDYTGSTTVTGTLTVAAGAIGDASARTAELIINAGKYINAGANTVGTLSASGGALELNDTLTIEDGGSNTISGGSISGTGALALNSGALMINGLQDSDYTGRVTVGTTAGGASISFESGTAGIGTGIVAFANNNSIVSFTGSDDLTLTNTYSGAGTINVNLGGSGHVFAFNALQNLNSAEQFTGTLSLTNAQYQLYNDQTLAGAALRTNAGALVVVNADTLADRKVGSLTLGGGTIDFGQLSTTTPEDGQIRTDHLSFDAGDHTTINLSLGAFADADGSAVFGSGEKLYLFEGEFDRDNARNNLDQLTLDADATTQIVTQGVNDVARLHYNSGDLGVDADGIYAGWTLDTIELLTDANGGLNVTANGTISAIVSGSGDITFTGADAVVTIGGGEDNTYTGSTFVSSGAQVTLGRNEALGDTENLAITSGASVAFGGYTQTIGALNVDSDGSFSLAGGQITLGDNSVIRSANENVSGRIAVTNGHSLTLTNENAVGDAAVELGAADTLRLQGVGSGSAAGPAVFDNLIAAAAGTSGGIVSIEAGADVELQNTSNQFTQANIDATSTLHVNGMDATQTALGSAALNVSGTAVLAGNGTWTLSNGLAVDQAGALALSANGGEFNFGGMNQSVDGTVDLTNAVLRIGGNANATVLQNAELLGGTGANIHIATGSTAQTLDSLRLSGGHIWFDGVLGIGNAPTSQLGQLTVGSLGTGDDLAGTVHLTVSEDAASGGTIQSSELLTAADNGRYQSLITITGVRRSPTPISSKRNLTFPARTTASAPRSTTTTTTTIWWRTAYSATATRWLRAPTATLRASNTRSSSSTSSAAKRSRSARAAISASRSPTRPARAICL